MIKSFKKFCEAISGWELVGNNMGPNYPKQEIPNTINQNHTQLILGIDDKMYSHDDYLDVYNDYIKSGGRPLDGFNKKNLDEVLHWNSKI